jgi:hypothetical protein
MVCRHCQRAPVNRPRGLCWVCYYTPGLKNQYPSTSKFGRRGLDDFYGELPLATLPTRALPGSHEKIAVLQERALCRQSLWHPEDGLAGAACRRRGVA